MRVVLDTNAVVSRFLSPSGAPARIFAAWEQGVFDLLVSASILGEYRRVLGEERIRARHGMNEEELLEIIQGIGQFAIRVDPEENFDVIVADPNDNQFIDGAVAGNAAYIVSGDAHLLAIEEYRGIPIIRPSVFLAILSSETKGTAE